MKCRKSFMTFLVSQYLGTAPSHAIVPQTYGCITSGARNQCPLLGKEKRKIYPLAQRRAKKFPSFCKFVQKKKSFIGNQKPRSAPNVDKKPKFNIKIKSSWLEAGGRMAKRESLPKMHSPLKRKKKFRNIMRTQPIVFRD